MKLESIEDPHKLTIDLNAITNRVELNQQEYNFVGNSAQKDYEELIELEKNADEDQKDKISRLKEQLENNFDINK